SEEYIFFGATRFGKKLPKFKSLYCGDIFTECMISPISASILIKLKHSRFATGDNYLQLLRYFSENTKFSLALLSAFDLITKCIAADTLTENQYSRFFVAGSEDIAKLIQNFLLAQYVFAKYLDCEVYSNPQLPQGIHNSAWNFWFSILDYIIREPSCGEEDNETFYEFVADTCNNLALNYDNKSIFIYVCANDIQKQRLSEVFPKILKLFSQSPETINNIDAINCVQRIVEDFGLMQEEEEIGDALQIIGDSCRLFAPFFINVALSHNFIESLLLALISNSGNKDLICNTLTTLYTISLQPSTAGYLLDKGIEELVDSLCFDGSLRSEMVAMWSLLLRCNILDDNNSKNVDFDSIVQKSLKLVRSDVPWVRSAGWHVIEEVLTKFRQFVPPSAIVAIRRVLEEKNNDFFHFSKIKIKSVGRLIASATQISSTKETAQKSTDDNDEYFKYIMGQKYLVLDTMDSFLVCLMKTLAGRPKYFDTFSMQNSPVRPEKSDEEIEMERHRFRMGAERIKSVEKIYSITFRSPITYSHVDTVNNKVCYVNEDARLMVFNVTNLSLNEVIVSAFEIYDIYDMCFASFNNLRFLFTLQGQHTATAYCFEEDSVWNRFNKQFEINLTSHACKDGAIPEARVGRVGGVIGCFEEKALLALSCGPKVVLWDLHAQKYRGTFNTGKKNKTMRAIRFYAESTLVLDETCSIDVFDFRDNKKDSLPGLAEPLDFHIAKGMEVTVINSNEIIKFDSRNRRHMQITSNKNFVSASFNNEINANFTYLEDSTNYHGYFVQDGLNSTMISPGTDTLYHYFNCTGRYFSGNGKEIAIFSENTRDYF
ncbi:MAG: hypothetical protein MHMPM18_002707, partial [Marteilia pararefringens]